MVPDCGDGARSAHTWRCRFGHRQSGQPGRHGGRRGRDLLLPVVRQRGRRRRLGALAAERQHPSGADRLELVPAPRPLFVGGSEGRPRADEGDRVGRHPDRDRLLVGTRFRRGDAPAARAAVGPEGRPERRDPCRTVQRTDARDPRAGAPGTGRHGHQGLLHLRLDHEPGRRMARAQPAAAGPPPLREHGHARQGGRRGVRRPLHLRRPHLRRHVVPAHVCIRPHAQPSLRSLGRAWLRRPARDRRDARARQGGRRHVRQHVAKRGARRGGRGDDHELQRVARGNPDRAGTRGRATVRLLRRRLRPRRACGAERLPRPHRELDRALPDDGRPLYTQL